MGSSYNFTINIYNLQISFYESNQEMFSILLVLIYNCNDKIRHTKGIRRTKGTVSTTVVITTLTPIRPWWACVRVLPQSTRLSHRRDRWPDPRWKWYPTSLERKPTFHMTCMCPRPATGERRKERKKKRKNFIKGGVILCDWGLI